MPAHVRRSLPRAALLVAAPLLLLAACGDDDDPVAPVATLPVSTQALDSAAATIAPLGGHPLFRGLFGAGYVPGLPFDFDDPFVPPALRGDLTVAGPPRRPAAQLGGIFEVDASLRGRTFVEDTLSFSNRWRVDTLANGTPRPGAPANGVRFTLYALGGNGLPTGPALGYLEVTDNSTATSARWTTRVVTNAGLTIVQTSSTMTGSGGAIAITQSGFVTDGTRRIEQSLSLSSTALRASWSAPWAGLSMDFALTQSLSGATLSYTFGTPRGTLRLVATVTTSGGNAQILVNGAPWARQSWGPGEEIDDNAWQKADGSGPITEADALTMLDILDFFAALNALADFDDAVTGLLGGVTPA